jgi:hypothetical protein
MVQAIHSIRTVSFVYSSSLKEKPPMPANLDPAKVLLEACAPGRELTEGWEHTRQLASALRVCVEALENVAKHESDPYNLEIIQEALARAAEEIQK